MILCSVGDVINFEHGCYILALEHVRILVLSGYVFLACINAIYKCDLKTTQFCHKLSSSEIRVLKQT